LSCADIAATLLTIVQGLEYQVSTESQSFFFAKSALLNAIGAMNDFDSIRLFTE
jgi:hypothetical protein